MGLGVAGTTFFTDFDRRPYNTRTTVRVSDYSFSFLKIVSCLLIHPCLCLTPYMQTIETLPTPMHYLIHGIVRNSLK